MLNIRHFQKHKKIPYGKTTLAFIIINIFRQKKDIVEFNVMESLGCLFPIFNCIAIDFNDAESKQKQ